MFDTTVTLGNVLSIAVTVSAILGFFHRYDKKIDERHIVNVKNLETTTTTLSRIECKVQENTNITTELNVTVAKHIASDDVKHDEFDRRLDRLEE